MMIKSIFSVQYVSECMPYASSLHQFCDVPFLPVFAWRIDKTNRSKYYGQNVSRIPSHISTSEYRVRVLLKSSIECHQAQSHHLLSFNQREKKKTDSSSRSTTMCTTATASAYIRNMQTQNIEIYMYDCVLCVFCSGLC